ncbi:MAG: hypothetical protein BSOLF_1794 [Candidatus Carbobacillus altaicus]|uniref:Uncharacterized protein n=1 Tax=Candidatus Carbonibacillus altaicus TaxID=2163959 RepID=A0A2R6XYP3_9BACL|nr:MAG: hypothetical protein BSOLF_1898 [Candidatus Carbobacillus altaicus]PTQ55606.1 MAG: hypothetical protein BSOLF_1794 [Candidatus Carbobacillus altaicus]
MQFKRFKRAKNDRKTVVNGRYGVRRGGFRVVFLFNFLYQSFAHMYINDSP